MLRQAENRVKVEGILNEIDLETKALPRKDGSTIDGITGRVIVKVNTTISGEDKELMIPVHVFAYKLTNAGKPNPAYESLLKVKNEFLSVAATGDENAADRVRITGANIRMNEYYSQDGRLISFPRINASFINKIRKEECKPEATCSVEFVVAQKREEVDRNGEPTGRYMINAVLPQYGGLVDVVPFYAESEGVINAVSQYWNEGDTVKANCRLNFTTKVETTYEDVDFGEPIERTRTTSVSDIVIIGGSQTPVSDEFAFDSKEIQDALTQRKARLESLKERSMSRVSQKATPSANPSAGFADLGF